MARIDNQKYLQQTFGGFNMSTAFFGWLVTAGVSTLLGGLFAGLGGITALTTDTTSQEAAQNASTLGIVGGLLLLLVLAVAYYAGGYVAGRMARFDGRRQGLGVWLMGLAVALVLAIGGAVVGANLLESVRLPSLPINAESLSFGGLLSLLITAAVTLLAATLGGQAGSRYHDKVDRTINELNQEEQLAQARSTSSQTAQPSFGERIEREDKRR